MGLIGNSEQTLKWVRTVVSSNCTRFAVEEAILSGEPTDLSPSIEDKAHAATSLAGLAINLHEIKRNVTQILSLFGRNGIFKEYTMHDITHIDDLLRTVEWMIPKDTKYSLTPAECVMIVLSIYFHDIGLVVTDEEFKNRKSTGFMKFCNEKLFAGDSGADYKSKIDALPEEQREKFLYQEFVRSEHGQRVRTWLEGRPDTRIGDASALASELNRLLSPLDKEFRKDLGIICESHGLDDLDDVDKYQVDKPYGDSDDLTVNMQYCAIVLRSADLMQITNHRTPAVIFRLINPSDPISQIEWTKQAAVRRVRPKAAVDREGNVTSAIQSNTIEVFANLTTQDSFFGLTSYLRYAKEQIASSYSSNERAKRLTHKKYDFPWRYIDDANVQVEGFEKEPFGFTIDEEKVLNLLTGHTLYNDSDVVVRELLQNAIDAVRLQCHIDQKDVEKFGDIKVCWKSDLLELTVVDNGTGMTQHVIENHFLKVGSSKYQDPKFREDHPEFFPISRFGIGVLSSFMVADTVEIVTMSREEEKARQISLRSVHGKYLIRLLDKVDVEKDFGIINNGTFFRIKLRASANQIDILSVLRRWVLFPRCKITAFIDKMEGTKIGYGSPREAIESFLKSSRMAQFFGRSEMRVEEKTIDGFRIAYALRYSSHYRDWSLALVPDTRRWSDESLKNVPIGTCVEGIAVEFESPGYRGSQIIAIANATGKDAPKTNVARSSMETTDEREIAARKAYSVFFDNASSEVERLVTSEKYSRTWAINQFPYLLGASIGTGASIRYPAAHREELSKVPMFLIERDGKRASCSLRQLEEIEKFWTVESQLNRSVEQFIRESSAEVTAQQLMSISRGNEPALPDGSILTNVSRSSLVQSSINAKFEVSSIICKRDDRRIDLEWSKSDQRWLSSEALERTVFESGNYEAFRSLEEVQERIARGNFENVIAPIKDVVVSGLEGHFAVRVSNKILILPDNAIRDVFVPKNDNIGNVDWCMQRLVLFLALGNAASQAASDLTGYVSNALRQLESQMPEKWLAGRDELLGAMENSRDNLRLYDPLSWSERENHPYARNFRF